MDTAKTDIILEVCPLHAEKIYIMAFVVDGLILRKNILKIRQIHVFMVLLECCVTSLPKSNLFLQGSITLCNLLFTTDSGPLFKVRC